MREQRPVLEDEPDPAILGRHVYPRSGHLVLAQPDLALMRFLQPCDNPEQGGLAASARAENRQLAARLGFEVDALEHGRGEVDVQSAHGNATSGVDETTVCRVRHA